LEKVFNWLKKRGFTFAEALVVTLLVGYIMVPIVGTLQQGISRTENFDHRAKLRELARSRLNKEVSVGAFDLQAVDTNPTYHYVYYTDDPEPVLSSVDSHLASDSDPASFPVTYSSILYSYKTEVEVKENLIVDSETGIATFSDRIKGLKAIVVRSELEYNDNVLATDSVSYFSLLNIPSFSEEFLWVAYPLTLKILCVDPFTRTIVDTFQWPKLDPSKAYNKDEQNLNRPWNIAIHPSGKIVAAVFQNRIEAINVFRTHSSYRNTAVIANHPAGASKKFGDVKKDDPKKAREDRGVVFRPDGKYCFVTSHDPEMLYVYKTDVGTATFKWPPDFVFEQSFDFTSDTETDHDKFTDLVAGHDGFLYVCVKDRKAIVRFPMYPKSFDNWDYEKFIEPAGSDNLMSVSVSRDGRYFYAAGDSKKLGKHLSFPPHKVGVAEFNGANGIEDKFANIAMSYGNAFVVGTDKKEGANQGGLKLIDVSSINFSTDPGTLNVVDRVYPFSHKAMQVIQTPIRNEFAYSEEKDSHLFFADRDGILVGSFTFSLPPERILSLDTSSEPPSDLAAICPNLLWVASEDGGGSSWLRFVDLHRRVVIEDRDVAIATSVLNISLSATGIKGFLSFGANKTGFDIWNANNQEWHNQNQGAANSYKCMASRDWINPPFFANGEKNTPGGSAENGYWIPDAIAPAAPDDAFKNTDIVVQWEFQDMVALPTGGFMLLFKHSGTNECQIHWVDRMLWGADKNKYKRFAVWRTTTDNFPPSKSHQLAISPDGNMLAIEVKDTPQHVHLYDISVNNFGHWSQLNGLIADYRANDNISDYNYNFAVAPNCSFLISSPIPDTGISLASCTTSIDVWRSHQNYPGNYFTNGGSNNGFVSNDARNDAIKRFFGYYIPGRAISKFGIAQLDAYRLFFDHFLHKESTNSNPTATDELTLAKNAFSKSTLQINHKTNGGERLFGLFTMPAGPDIAPGALSVAAGDAHFDDDLNEMAGFNKIASTSTRPFQFAPVLLASYTIPSLSDYSGTAMCFNRDASDPILFFVNPDTDDIWVIKLGYPITGIDPGISFNFLNKQLTVSEDGQILIYGRQDNNTLNLIDISDPESSTDNFNFDGSNHTQANLTGFGRKIDEIQLSDKPTAFATLPAVHYRSAAPKGYYLPVATMATALYGCNNAAVASGGIYIMGGTSATGLPAPTDNVLLFQPQLGGGANIASVTAGLLNNAVALHSTAYYDGKIYVFNGDMSGNNPTDWVQSYDVNTGQVRSSFDPALSGFSSPIQVNQTMSGAMNPSPVIVTGSGGIYSTYYGWKAFDGSISFGDGWMTNSSQSLIYNAGNGSHRLLVNKIWFNNNTFPSVWGANSVTLMGSNDNFSTTPYSETFNIPFSSTGWSQVLGNVTAFQYYKIVMNSNYGGIIWGIREIKFFLENIRKLPHVSLSSNSGPLPYTVHRSSAGGSSEEAWKAFDGNTSSFWEGDNYPNDWIGIFGGKSGGECVKFVRIKCNSSSGRLKTFRVQGASEAGFSSAVTINLADGSATATHPNNNNWYVYALDNSSNYRFYRVLCESSWDTNDYNIHEIEFYTADAGTTAPSEPILNKTMRDDRSTVKLRKGAACTTPFGIVVAGGLDASGNATSTAMVYWPHAIDEYINPTVHTLGISRSLPPTSTVSGHCLVWHKGYLYRVGGSSSETTADALFNVDRFDFENNSWLSTPLTSAQDTDNLDDPNEFFVNRFMPGACSLGDEIYIFGGQKDDGSYRFDAAAWNPDTGTVRQLGNIPRTSGTGGLSEQHILGITAVSYGPYIYLIGGRNSTSVGKEIIRFSP
jgi:hypothetical protein